MFECMLFGLELLFYVDVLVVVMGVEMILKIDGVG